MYSIDYLERAIQWLRPTGLSVELYAWNRINKESIVPQTKTTFNQIQQAVQNTATSYGLHLPPPVPVGGWRVSPFLPGPAPDVSIAENQWKISFSSRINGWERIVHKTRVDNNRDEVGIGSFLGYDSYLPFIDFEPGLFVVNQYTEKFWRELSKLFMNKKIYIFNSGNAYHGIVESIVSLDFWYKEYLPFLHNNNSVVDLKWINFAEKHNHKGVLRVTNGKNGRITPRLVKWVNL